jgi:hypothetical protein
LCLRNGVFYNESTPNPYFNFIQFHSFTLQIMNINDQIISEDLMQGLAHARQVLYQHADS